MFRKFFSLFCLSILSLACEDSDIKKKVIYSFELDGKYELIETRSAKPVDLNLDDTFSHDILLESNQIENKARFYVELESIKYDWEPTFYDQRVFLWSPLANVFTSTDGAYLRTEYGYTALLAKYHFDEEKNLVAVLGNLGGGSVDSIVRIGNDTLKISYRQFFYTSNGWEELLLISNYGKAR